MNMLIERLQKRKTELERLEILAKEDVLFVSHKLNPKVKYIFQNFGKMSAMQLAKKLRVNRSYIYAVIQDSSKFRTRKELTSGLGWQC